MSYTINYSGGSIIVLDNSLNTETSLSLPGRHYSGYGSPVDQDLVDLLENFASSTTSPANTIKGQIWFQPGTNNNFLNYNTSDVKGSPTWVKVAGSGVGMDVAFGSVTFEPRATAPTAPADGQTYYDSTKEKISYWDSNQWIDLPPTSAEFEIYGPGVAIGSSTQANQVNWYTGNVNQILLWANRYNDGANKYSSTGFAGQLGFDKTTGDWQFSNSVSGTKDSALTNIPRLTIKSNGQVGIGTSTPQANLDIVNTSGSGNAYANISNNGSSILSLNSGVLFDAGGAGAVFTPGAFPLVFGTNNTQRMRIDASGNVGIGGTATNTLDVTGTFKVSGAVTLNAQTYTFPATGGANGNVLTTNGSGTLTWAPAYAILPAENLIGTIPRTVLGNSSLYIGTTDISLTRVSASQTLTGVSIDGSANTGATMAANTKSTALATTAFVHNVLPYGAIIMWNGTAATIPTGWALCDGTNSTPNLVGMFIRGANAATALTSGGSDDAVIVDHTHTLGAVGNHTHLSSGANFLFSVDNGGSYTQGWVGGVSAPNLGTSAAGGHNHTITNSGVSGTGKNVPAYYALCYIMKTTGA